jgi:hypothetical protein
MCESLRLRDGQQESTERFGYGLNSWKPNVPVVQEYLRSWRALNDVFGNELFARMGVSRTEFWEVAAPWVEQFPAASLDFRSYVRDVAGTHVGRNTLDAMARLLPGSDELRETCLVDLERASVQEAPGTYVARILGIHFGGEAAVLTRLQQILDSPRQSRLDLGIYWRVVLSMCYGWPDSPVIQEWQRKPREQWEGMPWFIALHLDRIAGKPKWFLADLIRCLEAFSRYDEVRDEEIVNVTTLWASSEHNRSLLRPLLMSAYASDVATASGMLLRGGALREDMQREFSEVFESEVAANQFPPRTGLALSHGVVRPVAEVIFEGLAAGLDRPF